MKKIILSASLVLLLGVAANAQSQRDCTAILRDYFAVSGHNPDTYPPDKAEYYCDFSFNAFYLTAEVPEGFTIFQFTELTNQLTGTHPAPVTTLDLNTFSYYTYNFHDFQVQDFHRTIYFALSGNDHLFLAVRPYEEIFDRTNDPYKYKD